MIDHDKLETATIEKVNRLGAHQVFIEESPYAFLRLHFPSAIFGAEKAVIIWYSLLATGWEVAETIDHDKLEAAYQADCNATQE